jgi:hypothetical protein
MGCEEELGRLEAVIKKLAEDYSYMQKAEHECTVHGIGGMCDEYDTARESVKRLEDELHEALAGLSRCMQGR